MVKINISKVLMKWLTVFVVMDVLILVGIIQTVFSADIIVDSYTKAGLPAPGTAGRLARVTDDVRGLWMDGGNQWFGLNGEFVNAKEFGLSTSGTASANATALQTAIDSLPVNSGGIVIIPAGSYNIGSTISWDNKPVIIMGASTGTQPTGGTRLVFSLGVTGINPKNGLNGLGANSKIMNLHIIGSDTTPGTNDGILLQANSAAVIMCVIEGFGGSGIHVKSGAVADVTINANNFKIDHVNTQNNKTHGLFVEGVDSNAGAIIKLDASGNTGWGVYENGFLGNTYIAPHAAGNGSGAYRIGNISRTNHFIGAYVEGDATTGLQIDAGGGEGNFILFSQNTNTIVDNTIGRNNFIMSNNGQLHFSKLAVGNNSQDIVLKPLLLLLANGSQVQIQDSPLTANWLIQGVAGNLQISSAQAGRCKIDNPISIGSDGTAISRHLSATTTWDPPGISNGAAASTTVTVDGASVGNTVSVGFSQAVPGKALLVGAVTAANTVTVTLANHTGATLNLASGTLRADVWQH